MQPPGRRRSLAASRLQAQGPAEQREGTREDVTLLYSEEAGVQIIHGQDSLSHYCSLTSLGSGQDPHGSDADPAETVTLRAFTVLPVNGTVWIPRYRLDVGTSSRPRVVQHLMWLLCCDAGTEEMCSWLKCSHMGVS